MPGPAAARPKVIVPVAAADLPGLLAALDALAAPLWSAREQADQPGQSDSTALLNQPDPPGQSRQSERADRPGRCEPDGTAALRPASDAADWIEWRLDVFLSAFKSAGAACAADGLSDGCRAAVSEAWTAVRARTDLPVLVTVRTWAEGGRAAMTDAAYGRCLSWLLAAGIGDLVDLEWRRGIDRAALIQAARAAGRAVVLSAHDFEQTPDQAALEARMAQMAALNPDFVKVACMPSSLSDTLALMRATRRMAARLPVRLITVAMGPLGVLSRVMGHLYGSAATFAALTEASAPGQLPLSDLDALLSAMPTPK